MIDSGMPGVWPVMLTPFADNGCVDLEGLDALRVNSPLA